MTLTSGTRLGFYEIVGPLGAGGMGEVYRARDTRLGRAVALKVLPQAVASQPDRLARLEREARTVAALSHPNIVVLHSIEEAGGVRFLTMELVEGRSLDLLMRPGGLPLSQVLDIAIALSDALSSAHHGGVVHRDLKPANVMVTREGRVKVLDFGLAKLTHPEPDQDTARAVTMEAPISSVGQVVGTAPYMAPEQIRGDSVDARADLFSFGIILYELATGRRPFSGESFADVSSSILRDTPPSPRLLRGELSRDLERIVVRCLEKDRERRFQTAKDVRNELELVRREMGESSPVPVSRPSAPERAPAPVPAPTPSDAPSVAVLPFVNRSRDEEDEYFSDGLADELLSVLVKIRGLRVAARTSSATFKGKNVTIAEVGRALNVATVLEGSVRKAGNRVRITVQLVKVEDGFPLWSETYDRTLDDIFAVQDDIAQSVVKELRTTLLGEAPDSDESRELRADVAAAAKGRGENAEAHRLYLQGKYLVDRLSAADVAKGIGYLQEALALDPSLALAWVQLARALAFQAGYGYLPTREGYGRAREAAERALAIAPGLAEAYVRISNLKTQDFDWAGAQADAQRALELSPGSAEALGQAGSVAYLLCRFEEAVSYVERAIGQDPLSSSLYSQLGLTYRAMGRSDEAARAFGKALELSPQRISTHQMRSIVLADLGRDEEALAEVSMEPERWAQLTGLAYVHLRAGRLRDSEEAVQELERVGADRCGYQLAVLSAARGDADAAFGWIEHGLARADAGMALARAEPLFRPLHGDPRWKAFMRRVGFPD